MPQSSALIMATSEDFLSKGLAKKFFGDNIKDDGKKRLNLTAEMLKPAAAKSKDMVTEDVTEVTKKTATTTDNRKKATSSVGGGPGSFEFRRDPQGQMPIPAEDDEDAWETEEEDENHAKAKKGRKKFARGPFPWEPYSDDGYGYGNYDEVPELFMADPRDRDVAATLYGEHARFEPQFFSEPF